MDSETHFSIVFNIYGGSNQILPNATSATQNYYGDVLSVSENTCCNRWAVIVYLLC